MLGNHFHVYKGHLISLALVIERESRHSLHWNSAVKNGIQSLTSFPVSYLCLETPPCISAVTWPQCWEKPCPFKWQPLFLDFRNSPSHKSMAWTCHEVSIKIGLSWSLLFHKLLAMWPWARLPLNTCIHLCFFHLCSYFINVFGEEIQITLTDSGVWHLINAP